jgi:hypothetical protein
LKHNTEQNWLKYISRELNYTRRKHQQQLSRSKICRFYEIFGHKQRTCLMANLISKLPIKNNIELVKAKAIEKIKFSQTENTLSMCKK